MRKTHKQLGKKPKTILREEMEWHMKEITSAGNCLSESVVLQTLLDSTVSIRVWWADTDLSIAIRYIFPWL